MQMKLHRAENAKSGSCTSRKHFVCLKQCRRCLLFLTLFVALFSAITSLLSSTTTTTTTTAITHVYAASSTLFDQKRSFEDNSNNGRVSSGDADFTQLARASPRKKQPQPALSPLQAYLYSSSAAFEAVALTPELAGDSEAGSLSDTDARLSRQRPESTSAAAAQTSRMGAAHDGRRVLEAAALDEERAECRTCIRHRSSTSSSSSADSAAGVAGASFVHSFVGRYVVLSRTPAAPSTTRRTRSDAGVADASASSEPHDGKTHSVERRVAVEPLAEAVGEGSAQTEQPLRDAHRNFTPERSPQATFSADTSSSSSISSSSASDLSGDNGQRQRRVYPEVALRRLMQAASPPSRADAPAPAEGQRPTLQRRAASPLYAAPSSASSPSLSSSTASSTTSAPSSAAALEIHVIDATHVLVFLPRTQDSVELLRALASGTADGSTWQVWDAFAPRTSSGTGSSSGVSGADDSREGGGPQLKLSELLRGLFDSTQSLTSDDMETQGTEAVQMTTYEVTLWTARGRAAVVRDDLMRSARLAPYWQEASDELDVFSPAAAWYFPSPAVTAARTCRLTIEPTSAGADAVWVRLDVPVTVRGSAPASEVRASGAHKMSSAAETNPFFAREVSTPPSSLPASSPSTSTRSRRTLDGCFGAILHALASHPAVRWVEESYRRPELLNNVVTRVIQHGSCGTYAATPNAYSDDYTESAGHVPVWEAGYNGSGEVIAIADSGLDTESCFFRDAAEPIAYYPAVNTRHRKVISYQAYSSFKGEVDTTDQEAGHGTHVAGMAGGCVAPPSSPLSAHDGTADMSKYNGVATGAKLFMRDMNPGTTKELLLPTNLLEIFDSAYAVGARISSNSWGFPSSSTSYLAMEKMFDAAVAERRDLLVLVAAGNSGKDRLYLPGRAKNVLTVGSHFNSAIAKLQNSMPLRSAYGITYDRRRKPDLIAPGGGVGGSGEPSSTVLSAKAMAGRSCAVTSHHGTSMATAAAAGAAAITRQYLREAWDFANPSSALVRAALLHSTTPLPGDAVRSGAGRLDLSHLLPHRNHTTGRHLPPLEHWFVDDAVVREDEVHQYCFRFTDWPSPSQLRNLTYNLGDVLHSAGDGSGGSGGECSRNASLRVTATLVWNDPATAAEGSRHSQVHDLDVMLVTRHGHTFFSGAGGTAREPYNTVEQVRVPLSFDTGDGAATRTSWAEWRHGFRVLVRGAVVRSPDGQAFALAVSGPGLAVMSECAALFQQWRATPPTLVAAALEAPLLPLLSDAAPAPAARRRAKPSSPPPPVFEAFCAMNCTGHGQCNDASLLCQCAANFTSVDCAECNAAEVCHDRGSCDTATMTCTCDPRGHFADAYCATCQAGWYGPLCASNCTCERGGVCDTVTGLCACPQDTTLGTGGKGCFQGPRCEYCCEGFGGPGCNQRSYWCNTSGDVVVVDDPAGGFIQINGYKTYGQSLTCRWSIQAERGQQIHLQLISYKIESYDALYIYDVVPNTASATRDSASWSPTVRKHLRKITNSMEEDALVKFTSTAQEMYLEFISDWDGSAEGFVLYYRFTSCSEKCKLTNLTGPVGHWRCGDAFGLPTKQCICEPPYVGWNCNEDASDIGLLNRELTAMQISPARAWQGGELAWMMPRSVLTAAEVRLPVQLSSANVEVPSLRAAWVQWRSAFASEASTAAAAATTHLTVPVVGEARLPLLVHGFTEVQMPLLTLPTPAVGSSDAAGSGIRGGGARQQLQAHLKLRVQLLVDAAWLDYDGGTLGLTLGVSAATELAREPRLTPTEQVSPQGDLTRAYEDHNSADNNESREPTTAHHRASAALSDGAAAAVGKTTAVPYADTASALSLNGFTFTPMALQQLFSCADVPVIEITVPLNLVTNVTTSSYTAGTAPAAAEPTAANVAAEHTSVPFRALLPHHAEGVGKAADTKAAEDAVDESHWTSRVVFTLLWKDVAGLKVPNNSLVDALVVAHEVVLSRAVEAVAGTPTGDPIPAGAAGLRGQAVEVACYAHARVPVHTGQQMVEATSGRAAQVRKWSPLMLFLVVFIAICVGLISGVLWVYWTQDRTRPAYRPVQNTEDEQDMQVIPKRG